MLLSNLTGRILAYPNFDKLQRQGELFFCPPELEQELSDFLVKEKIYPCISDADIFLQYDILTKKYGHLIFEQLEVVLYLEPNCTIVKTSFPCKNTRRNAHIDYCKISNFCSWILSLKNPPKDLVDFARKYYA